MISSFAALRRGSVLLLWSLLAMEKAALLADEPPPPKAYCRFPALHGDVAVFTSEGDLWRVPITGGLAQRLTTHPGNETQAAFSPDGRTLAFIAEYEGPKEVYTMPSTGGIPVRRTFRGGNNRVAGWTPDGQVLFSTDAFATLPGLQLVSLNLETGAERVLPLAQASQGSVDPSGKTLIFSRLFKQPSSTKRYQGGWIESLWRFAEGDSEAVPLTADFKGTSRSPLWWLERIYFVSDRDGVMNLWSMKPDGTGLIQHTQHKDFDVKAPSLEGGRILYQHGADLRLFEIASATDRLLEIRLSSDQDHQRERWVQKPMDYLTSAHLSPNGDRLALTARGQVFVAPVEQGRFVEIPRKPDVRYRAATFLGDGKSLLTLSDESGEYEFWQMSANGSGASTAWTTQGGVFRFPGVPSPNGKQVAWTDKDNRLWIQVNEPRRTVEVIRSPLGDLDDLTWSPDSQWLAFSMGASNRIRQVHLYRVVDGVHAVATSDRVDSYSPAWAPDGQWLYFLSDREIRTLVPSPWGPRQPEPFFTETTRIYGLALRPGLPWPFAHKTELQPDKASEKIEADDKSESKSKGAAGASPGIYLTQADKADGSGLQKAVDIVLPGLSARLYEVPVPAGNYSHLSVLSKHLVWEARDTGFGAKTQLKQLEISSKDPKPKTWVDELQSYEVSQDGRKLLVRKGDAFHVISSDTAAPAKLEDKVNLEGWTFSIAPREEWRQIFQESWRMMRDYFYDRSLHQLDWPAIRKKYEPLVERVNDRSELSDVLYEMVGELSTLHISVAYGDLREGNDQIKGSFLGARWSKDAAAGGWRLDHLYRADPDYPSSQGPLLRPEVGLGEGDVITAINGRATTSVPDPHLLLRTLAGKQVLLDYKPRAGTASRQAVVTPITEERDAELRYEEWELTRRERVESLGAGAIGYVHLKAMGTPDMAQWAKMYFPVFNRQGLIIDVRNNRGGNIDAWILEKLLRKAWFYWQPRVGEPYWNMHYAFRGHVVVLCNERTASDGEAFTEGFKRLGLGKVIGTRTWGGEIWLSAQRWLVDSGMATAAEFGVYGPEGTWLIEGHGVDPDITVDNLPHATFEGKDAQLEAAVKHLQELIAKEPRPVPPAPKYPDKSYRP